MSDLVRFHEIESFESVDEVEFWIAIEKEDELLKLLFLFLFNLILYVSSFNVVSASLTIGLQLVE